MKHNPYREISAYLDGEAEAPEQVEALLREDPEARLRLEAYEMIRQSLQAAPRPLVDAAFTDRVLAAAEQRATIVPFTRARVLLSGMAALFLLAFGAWLLAPEIDRSPDTEPAIVQGDADIEGEVWAIAQLLAGEYDAWEVVEAADAVEWSEMDPLAPWDTHHDEAFAEAPLDLDLLLTQLAPDEEAALESLLLAYEWGDPAL